VPPADARSCGEMTVSPGVGSAIITEITAAGVSCRAARAGIRRYERHSYQQRFRAGGRTYRCARFRIGSPDSGISRFRCHRGDAVIRWRSNYGI
jgi:hypothetical protein